MFLIFWNVPLFVSEAKYELDLITEIAKLWLQMQSDRGKFQKVIDLAKKSSTPIPARLCKSSTPIPARLCKDYADNEIVYL